MALWFGSSTVYSACAFSLIYGISIIADCRVLCCFLCFHYDSFHYYSYISAFMILMMCSMYFSRYCTQNMFARFSVTSYITVFCGDWYMLGWEGRGGSGGGQSEGQLRYWVSVCGQVGHITLCIHVSEDRWQRIGLQLCGWAWWINACLMWHTPEADRPGRLERTATHRVGVAVSNICTSPSCLWLTYRQQEQE